MKMIINKSIFADKYPEMETGWGTGYVIIPKEHKLHGVHYDDIHVDIHGGLTFASMVQKDMLNSFSQLTEEDIGGWMVGFDTAHYMDNKYTCPKEFVIQETNRLKEQLEKL